MGACCSSLDHSEDWEDMPPTPPPKDPRYRAAAYPAAHQYGWPNNQYSQARGPNGGRRETDYELAHAMSSLPGSYGFAGPREAVRDPQSHISSWRPPRCPTPAARAGPRNDPGQAARRNHSQPVSEIRQPHPTANSVRQTSDRPLRVEMPQPRRAPHQIADTRRQIPIYSVGAERVPQIVHQPPGSRMPGRRAVIETVSPGPASLKRTPGHVRRDSNGVSEFGSDDDDDSGLWKNHSVSSTSSPAPSRRSPNLYARTGRDHGRGGVF
ncbi:hypothetical protein GGS23DRAFT_108637 [Durotheca rogersii]|uniref:uncharacterized protein n=1 Tax=Durotheca rogersii TaxID=419775 RepID=UPI0022201D78|nr:uncharacterized protein GGS23DRAFT_108637 [Durotheca rogersii]KAI5862158.1 hypothetical protein GGS23DRAFT_108637 [Durotheca rogersii]